MTILESAPPPDRLHDRILVLEEQNRWHRFAMELLIGMRDDYDGSLQEFNPRFIFAHARTHLRRLTAWRTLAFLTVSEYDASFVLQDCDPVSDWAWIQREIEHQIAAGEFAWAVNQNRALVIPAREGGQPLILHVLTSRNRIRGMFVGVPEQLPEALPDHALPLLSMMLNQITLALENAELQRLLHEERRIRHEALKPAVCARMPGARIDRD